MQQPSEEQIANDLIIAGEDPNDPLARALYLEALKATAPRRSHARTGPTLISQIAAASHKAHSHWGDLLGVSRATVQAYGSGRIPENFDADDLAALRQDLEAQAAQLAAVIGEIAKLQNGALH